MSRESTPSAYFIHCRVLWLEFDTNVNYTTRGYYFGSLSNCHIQMPYHSKPSQEYLKQNGISDVKNVASVMVKFLAHSCL